MRKGRRGGNVISGPIYFVLANCCPYRELGSRVMIVQGSLSGEVAELMDKDKSRCRATLRLLHSGQLVQKAYEDICDFLGSSQDSD